MTAQDAIVAVRQRFITQVATPNNLAVVFDNAPEPAGARARVAVAIDGERQLTMGGARKFRATGTMDVELSLPRERGDAAVLTLAQSVIDAFQGATIASPFVRFTPPPVLSGALDVEDASARRTVRVPFITDYTA